MPDYGSAIYEASARPGQIVGQGLMGIGQVVHQAGQETELRKEKQETKRLARSTAILALHLDVAKQLPNTAARLNYLSAVSGQFLDIFDSTTTKDDFSKTLATVAVQDEENIARLSDDVKSVGKGPNTISRINELKVQYKDYPEALKILDSMSRQAENEQTHEWDREKEKRAETGKAKESILKGEILQVPTGTPGGTEYGGLILSPKTEAPKTREVKKGLTIETQEWNPKTEKYEKIATGEAFKPEKPDAENAVIQVKGIGPMKLSQINTEMSAITSALQRTTGENVFSLKETSSEKDKQIVIDRVKRIVSDPKQSPETRSSAQLWLNYAEARRWFSSEQPKPEGTPGDHIKKYSGAGDAPMGQPYKGKITR